MTTTLVTNPDGIHAVAIQPHKPIMVNNYTNNHLEESFSIFQMKKKTTLKILFFIFLFSNVYFQLRFLSLQLSKHHDVFFAYIIVRICVTIFGLISLSLDNLKLLFVFGIIKLVETISMIISFVFFDYFYWEFIQTVFSITIFAINDVYTKEQ